MQSVRSALPLESPPAEHCVCCRRTRYEHASQSRCGAHVGNWWMASRPRHPLWLDMLRYVAENVETPDAPRTRALVPRSQRVQCPVRHSTLSGCCTACACAPQVETLCARRIGRDDLRAFNILELTGPFALGRGQSHALINCGACGLHANDGVAFALGRVQRAHHTVHSAQRTPCAVHRAPRIPCIESAPPRLLHRACATGRVVLAHLQRQPHSAITFVTLPLPFANLQSAASWRVSPPPAAAPAPAASPTIAEWQPAAL